MAARTRIQLVLKLLRHFAHFVSRYITAMTLQICHALAIFAKAAVTHRPILPNGNFLMPFYCKSGEGQNNIKCNSKSLFNGGWGLPFLRNVSFNPYGQLIRWVCDGSRQIGPLQIGSRTGPNGQGFSTSGRIGFGYWKKYFGTDRVRVFSACI